MDGKIIAVMGPAFLIALISANGQAAVKEAKGGKDREYGAAAKLLGSWECRSQNANAGNCGTYKVRGNTINLSFSDGTKAGAKVHFRQPDGSVSEVMYDKALCQ